MSLTSNADHVSIFTLSGISGRGAFAGLADTASRTVNSTDGNRGAMMTDEYVKWLHETKHPDFWMAWNAGEQNIKTKVVRMIQQCVDRDRTLEKLAKAVEEL